MALFQLLDSSKLISRKIWVAKNFHKFQTVRDLLYHVLQNISEIFLIEIVGGKIETFLEKTQKFREITTYMRLKIFDE